MGKDNVEHLAPVYALLHFAEKCHYVDKLMHTARAQEIIYYCLHCLLLRCDCVSGH